MLAKLYRFLIYSVLTVSTALCAGNTPAQDFRGGCIPLARAVFYEHINSGGDSFDWQICSGSGDTIASNSNFQSIDWGYFDNWNDEVSSVRVYKGCLFIFNNKDYGAYIGKYADKTGSGTYYNVPNDVISSAILTLESCDKVDWVNGKLQYSSNDSSNGRTFRNQFSGKCLQTMGQEDSNGSNVNIWDCSNTSNQFWTLTSRGELRNNFSGKCLQTMGREDSNGSNVNIWDCSNTSNQFWR